MSQVSTVHGLASMHEEFTGRYSHPSTASQTSEVQGCPSPQAEFWGVKMHSSSTQVSTVQATSSLQVEPFAQFDWHPRIGSQTSAVMGLPSSHKELFVACVHPTVALHESSVQSTPSEQRPSLVSWRQAPFKALHVSKVQSKPSSQRLSLGM